MVFNSFFFYPRVFGSAKRDYFLLAEFGQILHNPVNNEGFLGRWMRQYWSGDGR